MFRLTSRGDYARTEQALNKMAKGDIFAMLSRFGEAGVAALQASTPVDSGETAASWTYQIEGSAASPKIVWTNSHMAGGTPVAIMLQYGHGTGTGGYVEGRDFINPAMRPIFDQIAAEVWKAVTSA